MRAEPYKDLDSKRFHLRAEFTARTDADQEAQDLRKSGYQARVIPSDLGFAVYYHHKSWHERQR